MENKTLTPEQFEAKMADAMTNALTKQLPEAIGLILDEKLKGLGVDKLDAKYKSFPSELFGSSKEELAKMDSKDRTVKFIKALFKKDMGSLATLKAMSEGTNSAGGYTVPQEWADSIDRVIQDFGLIRKFSREVPMTRDVMNMPTLSTSVTVYWPGENTSGTASAPVLGSPTLTAKTLIGITTLSNELLEDSNVSLVDFLSDIIGEAIAGEEDNQGLTGSGSPFTGVLSDTGTTSVVMATGNTKYSQLTAINCRDMIAQIKPTLLPGSIFVMHLSVWAALQETLQNSQFVVSLAVPVIGPQNGGTNQGASAGVGGPAGTVVGYIWGYPVVLSEKMPADDGSAHVSTKFAIFGNFKKFYLGNRKDMSMDISSEATVGSDNTFASNMSAVRLLERVAMVAGIPGAFAVLKTAAS